MASRPTEFVIDDSTNDHRIHGGERGLDLSLRPVAGVAAYAGAAEPFPQELLIPRSEWQARIEEMVEQKSQLSDLIKQADLPCKDQQRTNYCWVNAGTHCVEIVRSVQNQAKVILSPASAGAQIKNYRNEGGWGREALDWISQHGLVPVDKWPANAIDRQYCTPENTQLAQKYKHTEWWALDSSNVDQIISCLLRRVPISVGYSWWSHQVTAVDPVWQDGAIALRFRNSWGMSYGDQGFSILQGRRMIPDDACAPRVALAS
jgi:hypothetical protein